MPDTVTRRLSTETRDDLCDRLARALAEAGRDTDIHSMQLMADTGLAHHHVWLERDTIDWVARLPKQSQMGLDAQANLDYQAACFSRASASGHTPALHGVLSPSAALPRGGLLVSAVQGRPARLPDDLPAIAEALVALHRLELPPQEEQPPLRSPSNPWSAMCNEVEAQAGFLAEADLTPASRRRIDAELAALPKELPKGPASEPRLISFDAHPGNFLITESGRAVLVDLEKCRYGLPGFDLAHATLYTSTTWDIQSRAVLTAEEVAGVYRAWLTATGVDGDVSSLLACRRAMWLWSLTWCAKWRASHLREQNSSADGEDWSAELSDDALVAHVRDRVDHYLSLDAIAHVQAEFRRLESLLASRLPEPTAPTEPT